MSIKVEMFVKLPYVIRLDEEKDYKFSFISDEFEMFDLEMRFNDEDNDEIYNGDYTVNSCSNIRIEAIYQNCDYLDYKKVRIPYVDININEFIITLPFEETNKIFEAVNRKLEAILNYLRNESNMFWIETFPIKPISYCYGNEINYNFYSPNARLSKNVKELIKYTDYYMMSNSFSEINNVNEHIFDNFNSSNFA